MEGGGGGGGDCKNQTSGVLVYLLSKSRGSQSREKAKKSGSWIKNITFCFQIRVKYTLGMSNRLLPVKDSLIFTTFIL